MRNKTGRRAICLLSGGLDSATTLYLAKKQGFKARGLIFDYGQRHKKEILSARRICRAAKIPYEILKIRLPWKGSSLLDFGLALPREKKSCRGIPSTYVPARNTIFLSFALSYAEAIGAADIFIGANALDYSGYPDCRPAYFRAFHALAQLATRRGIEHQKIRIRTPLVHLKKSEIIRLGMKLRVPYQMTWSCYEGKKIACGACDSCVLRAKGFKEAGVRDPLL
jgi:7-cyano-7-deazaguanine synthase